MVPQSPTHPQDPGEGGWRNAETSPLFCASQPESKGEKINKHKPHETSHVQFLFSNAAGVAQRGVRGRTNDFFPAFFLRSAAAAVARAAAVCWSCSTDFFRGPGTEEETAANARTSTHAPKRVRASVRACVRGCPRVQ